jgi:tetrahydromethanopterin S-methyltransferase subunit H
MKKEAFDQYMKEKGQVDRVINKMIEEDQKLIELTKIKQQQAKTDMILSVNEKKEMQRRRMELEAYENDMLRRFAEQQQMREDEIRERKA